MTTCPLTIPLNISFLNEHITQYQKANGEYHNKQCGDDFMTDARWSPDGSTVSSVAAGEYLSFFEADPTLVLQQQYYDNESIKPYQDNSKTKGVYDYDIEFGTNEFRTGLSALYTWHMGSTVIDSMWYPFMNRADPASCCYITACRDKPIHLWSFDPNERHEVCSPNSNLSSKERMPVSRCSYRCYNQYDEIETCQALAFNSTGDKIYACTKNLIRVFDVNRPGRDCVSMPTTRFKRDPMPTLKGLISSVVFSPDPSSKIYSCGTYSNNLAVFVEGSAESVLMLHDVPVGGGITCQRWSPNGNHLWIGGRRSNDIICYDLRFSRGELGRVTRQLSTNQRLAFDMDPWGTYLATGSQNGELLIYDANHFNVAYSAGSNTGMDCTNSVVFHPHSSLLCMSTGQRKYTIELEDSNEVLSPHTGHSNQHDCLLRNSGLRLAMMSHQKLTYLST